MSACDKRESYLLGDLNSKQRHEYEAHLAKCSACSDVVNSWDKVATVVGKWQKLQPAPKNENSSVARLLASTRQQADSVWWRGRAIKPALGVASVAAVLLLMFNLGFFSLPRHKSATINAPKPLASSIRLSTIFSQGSIVTRDSIDGGYTLSTQADGHLIVNVGGDRVGVDSKSSVRILPPTNGLTRMHLSSGKVAILAKKRSKDERLVVEAGGNFVEVTGTCFSVSTDGAANFGVVVNEGSVSLNNASAEKITLRAGKSARLTAKGSFRVTDIAPADNDSILALLQVAVPQTIPHESTSDAQVERKDSKPQQAASSPKVVRNKARFDLAMVKRMIFDHRYKQAEAALQDRLKRAPRDADAWLLLAGCQRKTGRWREATGSLGNVVSYGTPKKSNRARFSSARIFQDRLGDARRAETMIRGYLAHKDKPLEAEAMLRLARVQESLGWHAAAVDTAREIIRRFRGTPAAQGARPIIEMSR